MLIFLILLFINGLCNGQSVFVDSLTQIWDNKELHDSTRLIAVHRMIVYDLLYNDPAKARLYSDQMKTFADSIGQPNQQAKALCNIGSSYIIRGDYPNSEEAFTSYLNFASDNNLEIHAANANYSLGDIQRIYGNIEGAIKFYEEAKILYSKNNYSRGLANSHIAQSSLESDRGNHVAALENYYAALDIYKEKKDVQHTILILANIGRIFSTQNDYSTAEKYFLEGLGLAQKENDKYYTALIYNDLGTLLGDQGEFDLAYEKYESAYNLTREGDYKSILVASINNLGWINLERKEFNLALPKFEAAIRMYEEQSDSSGISAGYTKKADALLGLGRRSEAIEAADAALLYARNFGDPELEKEAALVSYQAYKRSNSSKALAMHELYTLLKDSLMNEKIAKDVMRKEFEYENKAEILADSLSHLQELSFLEQKNSKQKNYILFGIIGLIGISSFAFFLFRLSKKLRFQNALVTKAVGEKDILLKEIHHRVKNNLQLVSSLLTLQSREIKDEKAIAAINAGKSRVRSMALIHQDLYTQDNLKGIGLKKYVENLAHELFSAYKIDHEKVKLKLDIEDINLDVDSIIPLGLIINELMTNALKYAFVKDEEGLLEITIVEKNGILALDVRDNGLGFDIDDFKKEASFGNKLISTLTDQLDGVLNVDGRNGTHVQIEIKDYKLAS